MLTIAIDTVKGLYKFDWDATAEEFRRLCDDLEKSAAREGHDPKNVAATAIHMVASKGAEIDPVKERGQAVWIVYAVLRHTTNNVDLSKMVDHAGVIAGPPTMLDLAAQQHITAKIRVDGGTITFNLAGRSALDS